MLDENTRIAILQLHQRGLGSRRIATALGISRGAVKDVIKQNSAAIPKGTREQLPESLRERIVELHQQCKGNLVRVHEELTTAGATFSYQTLTRFCRVQGIGYVPTPPAGHYEFGPGEEMQHDTSPHDLVIAGQKRRVQTASLVLCFSRMIFVQMYASFTRFSCKVFLTEALRYFDCTAGRCMVDNSHVVVASGTGKNMVPAPEMEAFAQRFGFVFEAHRLGDANRSAHVERGFDFVENNFLAGRECQDFKDLNAQARAWCDKVNGAHKRHLHAAPVALFAAERPALKNLPAYVPDVYQLHHRIVDVEGYISVDSNRYSVPLGLVGRRMEVRETKDAIEVFDGPRKACVHPRVMDPSGARSFLPEHRPPRGQRPPKTPGPDEQAVLKSDTIVQQYAQAFQKRHPDKTALVHRHLRRLLRDYPAPPLVEAVAEALQFSMFDLVRLERMVLRKVGQQFFNFNDDKDDDEDK